jgi:S1-C subfamily serine protease
MKRMMVVWIALAGLVLPASGWAAAQPPEGKPAPTKADSPDTIRKTIREEMDRLRAEIRDMVREEVERQMRRGPGARLRLRAVPPEAVPPEEIEKLLEEREGAIEALVERLRDLPGVAGVPGEDRGWLGVMIADAPADEVRGGVRITSVVEGSPAQKAGLKDGDIIVRLDGESVAGMEALVESIGSHEPGEKVKLVVLREGEETTITAELGRRTPEAGVLRFGEGFEIVPAPEAGVGILEIEEIETGARPWLGVIIQDLDEKTMQDLGVTQGVVVTEVRKGSPASAAGISVGDVIVRVGEAQVSDVDEVAELVGNRKVGEKVRFEIMREGVGSPMGFVVRLASSPEDGEGESPAGEVVEEVPEPGAVAPPTDRRGFLGVNYGDVDAATAGRVGVEAGRGVLVTGVVPDSAAEKAGLRRGDVLVAVNGQKLAGTESLPAVIGSFSAGDTITLTCARPGETRTMEVTLGARPGAGEPPVPVAPPKRMPTEPVPTKPAPAKPEAKAQKDKEPGYLGVEIRPVTDETRQVLGIPEGVGLVVEEIVAGSPAAAALEKFDILIAVDGAKVGDREALADVLAKAGAGTRVRLELLRRGKKLEVGLELGRR